MKKRPTRLFCAVLMGLMSYLPIAAQTQEKLTVAPDPSYAEGGPPAYRHPELDTDVYL